MYYLFFVGALFLLRNTDYILQQQIASRKQVRFFVRIIRMAMFVLNAVYCKRFE